MDPKPTEYYAVIRTDTHSIIAHYYSDSGADRTKPGASYDQSQLVHTVVPSDFVGKHHLTVVPSSDAESGYVFQIDQDAVDRMVKEQWAYFREQRDQKLKDTDWRVMVTDRPMAEEVRLQWVAYRQALRDLPSTTVDPTNVAWPVPPS